MIIQLAAHFAVNTYIMQYLQCTSAVRDIASLSLEMNLHSVSV